MVHSRAERKGWAVGVTWTEHSAPGGGATAVTYGNGLYVATVGDVITSPDGVTWTERSVPTANLWYSVTYGNGVFVAVGNAGGTYQVMTSPDGITWTDRATLEADTWVSVAYGNGTFVAVGDGSSFPSVGGHEVMTSPDGVTWTMRTGAEYAVWVSVTYGGGAFVAVGRALDATHHEVMTSTDGATWTAQAQAENNNWEAVTYGNNLFVAVAHTTFGHPVMTSTAGTTFSYTTNWTVPETARLAQMSAYFQQPAEQVQRTCVAFVDFLLRIANPPIPPSHVPPPSLFGPTAVTSSWTSADIGFLHDVQAQYSLSPEAAQKLATGLVSFFLALGGH